MSSRILVVDNYDSFVWTIVGYLAQLGAEVEVVRNDALAGTPAEIEAYDGVLVSPGPGAPAQAGASMRVIEACAATGTPMLGICLGHQALAEVFGARVSHASELVHGKTSPVVHTGAGVLEGLPSPFTATRYHSLAVEQGSVPPELEVTAWVGSLHPGAAADDDDSTSRGDLTDDVATSAGESRAERGAIVMALRHRELPLHGVQFHPESVLTEGGHRLLATWLAMTGDTGAVARSDGLRPLAAAR